MKIGRDPQPFRPKVFLYRALVGIFIWEGVLLSFAFYKCSRPIKGEEVPLITQRCPALGDRAQGIFSIAVATCLSLLSGAKDGPAPP